MSGANWAPVPLRLVLGIGFIYHGYPKVFSSEGHAGFEGMLQNIGVPAPALMSWVVGLLEFGGGVLMIVGLLVPLVAALLVVNMIVALFKVHLQHGFNFMNVTGMTDAGMQFGMPGYEVPLLYMGGLLALVIGGAGHLSLGMKKEPKKQEG